VAALLTHASPEVREAAVLALQRLPNGGAYAREVAKRLREDASAGVRAAAVSTLAGMGGPDAISALTAAAQDPDGRVQYLARESLRRLGFRR
jgi:HEAT repeat protein